MCAFEVSFHEQKHAKGTIDHYRYCCRHFVAWLGQHRVALAEIDEAVVDRFAAHECICPGMFVKIEGRNRQYLFNVRRFVRYLVTIGVIPSATTPGGGNKDETFTAFRDWLRRHRGISEQTTLDHVRVVTALLAQLGRDPGRYDAALINRVMLQHSDSTSL